MSTYDVLSNWNLNIPEQFKNKTNMTKLRAAFAAELQEVAQMFDDLKTLRNLQNAEGAQLDRIGDIVVLQRDDAAKYYNGDITAEIFSDDYYRVFLAYKIALNSGGGTYRDIVRALKMLYNVNQVFYSEDPASPATLYITIGGNFSNAMIDLLEHSKLTPKAAGVGVILSYYDGSFFGFGDMNRFAQGFGKAPFAHSLPEDCYI